MNEINYIIDMFARPVDGAARTGPFVVELHGAHSKRVELAGRRFSNGRVAKSAYGTAAIKSSEVASVARKSMTFRAAT